MTVAQTLHLYERSTLDGSISSCAVVLWMFHLKEFFVGSC